MKKLFALTLLALIISCGKDPKESENDTEDPSVESTVDIGTEDVDTSNYSEEFLKSFRELQPNMAAQLKENYLLVDNDTVHFPEDLKLNKNYHLTGFTERHFYQLDLRRVNLTSIEFEYAVFENESQLHEEKGIAHLGGGFFLGSETDQDDETGDGYLATEYYLSHNKSFGIRVGEPDEQGRIRAVVNSLKPFGTSIPHVTLRESM